jgi:hypothetical protein
MTDLASLVVKLEAQTAQYDAAIKRATAQLSAFRKGQVTAIAIGTAFANVAIDMAKGLFEFAASAVESADRMGQLAQQTGMSTEAFSQMAYAAAQSNVSLDELAIVTAKLSKAAVAASKDTGKANNTFKALGVAATDAAGKVRPVGDLLLDIADKFSKMEDGAVKSALAQDIFGKSGAKLIPFLNQGRAGITALMQELDKMGGTITGKTAAAADEFGDNLDRMKTLASGMTVQIVEETLPMLVAFQQSMLEAAQAGGTLEAAAKGIAQILKVLATGAVITVSVFQQLGQIVYANAMAFYRLAHGEFRLAAEEIAAGFAKASDNVAGDIETIVKIWSDSVPPIVAAERTITEAVETTAAAEDEAAKAAQKLADERASALGTITTEMLALEQQVATYGMGAEAVARYRLEQGDLAETMRLAGEAAAPYAELIVDLTGELERLKAAELAAKTAEEERNAILEEGARVHEAMLTPAEQYAAQLERLNVLLQKTAISQTDYDRAVAAAQEKFEAAVDKDNEFAKHMRENVQDIIADGMINGVEDGARGVLRSFVDMLLKMQAQALAADIASKLFGKPEDGGGGAGGGAGLLSGLVGALFGGSRDAGGRGSPGHAYAIGTGAQPEMFVPDRPGSFYPNKSSSANVTVRPQIINVRDPSEIPNALQSGAGEAAIINTIARNPSTIRQLLQG